MSDPDHFDDEELVSANAQQRNWRGILIALLVIVFVLALIVTSVIVLTPPDDGPRIKGTRFRLGEILNHEFQSLRFNGSWISSNELMYRDHWGGISIMNVEDLSTRSVLSNHTFGIVQSLLGYCCSPCYSKEKLKSLQRKFLLRTILKYSTISFKAVTTVT